MEAERVECCQQKQECVPSEPKKPFKPKRDIFRVNGTNPAALNLDHVTMITLQDKRLTFSFGTNGLNVDMESEELAVAVYEQLLQTWAGDVLA